jgi:tRNA(Ile)-lysidine synthase
VADPTNDDPTFRRNRVRHEVLPLLDAVARRDVAPILARQADLARDDAEALGELAAGVDPRSAGDLAAVHPAVARRAVRAWLRAAGPGGAERYPPDAAAVERVLAVARGDAVACELAGGWRVARTRGRLRVEAPGEAGAESAADRGTDRATARESGPPGH